MQDQNVSIEMHAIRIHEALKVCHDEKEDRTQNHDDNDENWLQIMQPKVKLLFELCPALVSTTINLFREYSNLSDGIFTFDHRTDLDSRYTVRTCSMLKYSKSAPIHWAVYYGNIDAVKMILEADPTQAQVPLIRSELSHIDGLSPKSATCTLRYLPLHIALIECWDHDPDYEVPRIVEYLCEVYPEALSVPDMKGNLPLHLGVECYSLAITKYLIEKYPRALSCPNHENMLPLHRFITEMIEDGVIPILYIETLRVLIESYPDALSYKGSNGTDYEGNVPLAFLGFYHVQYAFQEDDIMPYFDLTKLIFEYGLRYNAFGPDTAGGLFEQVHFNHEWFNPNLTEDRIEKVSMLELYLSRHRLYEEYTEEKSWNIALRVFDAAIGKITLDKAFGNVQCNLLPMIIDKFEVPLDLRTALIPAITYVAENSYENSDFQSGEGIISFILDKHRAHIPNVENGCNQAIVLPLPMMKDVDGRLPLHIGADLGLKWSFGLEDIMNTNIAALDVQDPITKLYPFILAGVGMHSDLTSIFKMFVSLPDVLEKLH